MFSVEENLFCLFFRRKEKPFRDISILAAKIEIYPKIYIFFLGNRAAKHESLGLLVRNAIRGEAGGCGEGGMGVGGLCGGWLGVENLGWKKSLPQDLWNSLDV